MGNLRRYYIPESIVFITQIVFKREPALGDPHNVDLLREVLHNVQDIHPFAMTAYVFLPDHFHIMIQPTGNSNFSQIMQSLKSNFTYIFKQRNEIRHPVRFWQRRFWDHVIRSEDDFARHLDYIHYNPVSHGLTTRPESWTDSSFIHWRERGVYPEYWGWTLPDTLAELELTAYE